MQEAAAEEGTPISKDEARELVHQPGERDLVRALGEHERAARRHQAEIMDRSSVLQRFTRPA